MAVETIIEGLWEFVKACPLFEDYAINVNWKEDDPNSAAIIQRNVETIETYVSGTELKKMTVMLYLGALSDADILRIENSTFLEQLRKWFLTCSDNGDYPDMPEDCIPQNISAQTAVPYDYSTDGKKTTYAMQILLDYIEER